MPVKMQGGFTTADLSNVIDPRNPLSPTDTLGVWRFPPIKERRRISGPQFPQDAPQVSRQSRARVSRTCG